MLNKFIDIFKSGMKIEYLEDTEEKENYWNELVKQYKDTYEMGFIVENIYDKKIMKIRQYFGLLIHSKKIYQFLADVIKKMPYVYENAEKKAESL